MSKKEKIRYPVTSPKGMTRPGTKPNKPGTKLVCVKASNGEVRREPVYNATQMVKYGWVYCSKSEWKTATRGGVQSVQE